MNVESIASTIASLINDKVIYDKMTDISTLKEIIQDGIWLLDQDEPFVEREIAKQLLVRMKYGIVDVATGVRRAGKSTILLRIGRLLKSEGKKIYYINFEDDRFFPDKNDLQNISGLLDLKDAILLIDEPQNIQNWERWIRRMHDRKIKIYLTGSNSKLLGSELATSLGGRKKQHEIFPFSFPEYLLAKGETNIPVDQRIMMFDKYLMDGGYPYPVITNDYSVLSDYRNDIIERDIILRHKIRNVSEFRDLTRFILSNPGLYLSQKSIRNFLDISHVTLRKYLDYLIEAYAVIPLEKFSYSQKEQMANPKKVYPVDNGLLIKKNDSGRLIECCIVQHIRRRIQKIFYWKDERGREVDIYLPDKKLAIQVVYSLSNENIRREERALESIINKFSAKPLIVYLYSEIESKYPTMRVIDFIENLDEIILFPETTKNYQ